MNAHGRRKVLLGSTHRFWPATDRLQCLDLEDLGLDDQTPEAFLHNNAVTAFGR
jgi:predicted TIM-barrel fold metal-dependent hydrolase